MSGSETRQLDPTGVRQLDQILGGGIPRGTLMLVVGPPGSGKTTLASQMAFAAALSERQVLILTALSEPTDKLMAHLRTFRFFDEHLVGGAIQIVSLRHYIARGLDGAAEMIAADARHQHASLVVLDGFSGVRGVMSGAQAAREFLYDLGTTLGILGCTVLVTTEGTPRESTDFAEMTTADLVVGLHYALRGVRESRALEVIKVRGAALLPGLHGLELGARGIEVYPRLEAVIARDARDQQTRPRAQVQPAAARAAFELPALDALLGGGLPTGSTTVILGSAGVGKTLLGLQWASAGARSGQPTVFLSFHETEAELRRTAGAFAFGPDFERALASEGTLVLLRYPSVERDVDALAAELLAAIDRVAARRLVIDSLAELRRAIVETSGAERVAGFLAALAEALRLRQVTTLVIQEAAASDSGEPPVRADTASLVAANVLWLRQVTYQGRQRRVLSVPKLRFSAHDATLREYTIRAPEGLYVRTSEESMAGLVAGIARQVGQAEHPLEGESGVP